MICPIDQQPCTFPVDAHNGDRCNEECSLLMTTLPAAPARSGRRKVDHLRGDNTQPDFRGLTSVPGVTPAILDKHAQACFNGDMTNEQPLTIGERRLSIGFTDLRAAIRHDANIARKEGFLGVAERADSILRDLDRIDDEFGRKQQVGYKVEIVITPTHDARKKDQ